MEKPLQIAIAHKNAQTRHALYAAVAQLEHTVCVLAETGTEFVKSAKRPDLVVVQEYLPDMTGLEAVRQACGNEAVPTIVVIDANNGQLLGIPESANVLAVLREPVRSSDLMPIIPMVMRRFDELTEMRNRVQDLQRELDDLDA